jgi:hypothetical protein
MLQNKAMLVNLSISRWAAKKTDKKVTREVTRAHGATDDAGDFRKTLVDKAHLAALKKSESAMRANHYRLALPWEDDGDRLLPSALFPEYTQTHSKLKLADEQLRREFIALYPSLVNGARGRLGSMYDPKDFPDPSVIGDKFAIKMFMKPIPDAKDFRVDVGNEAAAIIRAELTAENDRKFELAMKDVYSRIHDQVKHISETLNKEDPRIFDSLVNNAKNLIACLPGLNLTNDPFITELAADLDAMLPHPDALRTSPTTRQRTADAADAIVAKMAGYV